MVNGTVTAIVDAEQEQSSGLQQINSAVNQMDHDAQANAAIVSKTTSTSHSLASEVVKLSELLDQFTLPGGKASQVVASVREAMIGDRPKVSPVNNMTMKLQSRFGRKSDKDNWEAF